MAAEPSRTAGGTWNLPEHEYAGSADGADGDEDHILRHHSTVSPRSRQRSASCPSMLQPRPSLSPLESWDDSTLTNKRHITGTFLFNIRQDSQCADYQYENSDEAVHDKALSTEEDQLGKDQVQMGITIRRKENINVFDCGMTMNRHLKRNSSEEKANEDGSSSETYLTSGPPSPTESDSRVDFVEKRLLHPDDYFQELDDLGSKILKNSNFKVYRVSSKVVHKTRKIAE
jgi:hypothetical protein